ncbi:MAG TPA: sigma-70 family RNA polymerase sigma factor [Actinomycetota bacterium]|nr:sigma-70 family RNA polymerase sigma factor [Actinomycetota bacterium]
MTDRVEGRPLEDVGFARLDDVELVGRARDGDVSAYGELVERYREVTFRTAWLITRSSAEAEDAAQEAFVKAFYALGRFRVGEAFRPWILRIVSNEAKNRRRSTGRRERLTVRLARDRGSGDAAPSPETAALGREQRETLLRAIDGLPERERLVVTYRYLLELSEAETARALGIRPGTVKSRLSRGLGRLRQELATKDTDDG